MVDKKNQSAAETTQQQMESVRQWITSPEGQEAIAASLQRAHAQAARFREAERVKPEILLEPFTL